eukprot:TRINITY_DN4329_c0_g4_i2.p1 TRINITY_DN4329_c0_g4~~TRINITY_DN4329_c0_g4_i2.p1  ORF type:complete len:461 (+),score=180.83 TRINITY_DN4329_c0_g4_i2:583-1965(+)
MTGDGGSGVFSFEVEKVVSSPDFPFPSPTNTAGVLFFYLNSSLSLHCSKVMSGARNRTGMVFTRNFRAVNRGNLPIMVDWLSVNGRGCEGYGFKVKNCTSFSLLPGAATNISISFRPDFTASLVRRELWVMTSSQGLLSFPLVARIPDELLPLCIDAQPLSELEEIVAFPFMSFLIFLLAIVAVLTLREYGGGWVSRSEREKSSWKPKPLSLEFVPMLEDQTPAGDVAADASRPPDYAILNLVGKEAESEKAKVQEKEEKGKGKKNKNKHTWQLPLFEMTKDFVVDIKEMEEKAILKELEKFKDRQKERAKERERGRERERERNEKKEEQARGNHEETTTKVRAKDKEKRSKEKEREETASKSEDKEKEHHAAEEEKKKEKDLEKKENEKERNRERAKRRERERKRETEGARKRRKGKNQRREGKGEREREGEGKREREGERKRKRKGERERKRKRENSS